jgi:hypothetical protein
VDLVTGNVVRSFEYAKKVDLHKSISTLGSTQFGLAGAPAPVVRDSDLFVPWSGFARYDLDSGQLKWMVDYDTGIEDIPGAGTFEMTEETVYSSERGVIRAIRLDTGQILWQTKMLSDSVPQIFMEEDRIYAKLGGFLYNTGDSKYVPIGKPGFVALTRDTGQEVWRFPEGKRRLRQATTNAVRVEKGFLFSDSNTVYGLYSDGSEFLKQEISKDMQPKSFLYGCQLIDEQTVSFRSNESRLTFKIASRELLKNDFPRPKIPLWQRIAVVGIYVGGAYLGNSGDLAKSIIGMGMRVSAQVLAVKLTNRWMDAQRYDFFLTASKNDDKVKSLVRFDMQNAEEKVIVNYGRTKMLPAVDGVYGRVYGKWKSLFVAHDTKS